MRLEDRALMALDASYAGIGVVGTTANPTVPPFGVQEVGTNNGNEAGAKVTDVGDLTGDGFDDYVVSGIRSTVYLIFGSKNVDSTTITDFLALSPTVANTANPPTPYQRNGDITQLGSLNQSSPALTTTTTGSPTTGFDFQGLIFSASQLGGSNLGASVAGLGDLNGDGFDDFAIGAPGNGLATGPVPTVFIIYGSASLAGGSPSQFIDLSTPSSYSAISVRTLQDTAHASLFGTSIAAVGNVLGASSGVVGSGSTAIAIGAPGDSPTGRGASGAVYVIPANGTTTLSSAPAAGVATTPVIVNNMNPPTSTTASGIGQTGTNGLGGSLIIGGPGQNIGWSVAGAGNFSGQAGTNVPITDLLIGTQTADIAYLIYGSPTLLNTGESPFPIANSSTIINAVDLATISSTTTAPTIKGVEFTTATPGDQLGYAVSSAGDIDDDSRSDIMIGAPGASRVYLFNSQSYKLTGSVPVGVINFTATPPSPYAALPYTLELDGPSGSEAGFSLGTVGALNVTASSTLNLGGDRGLLIGAPGTSEVFLLEYAPNYDNVTDNGEDNVPFDQMLRTITTTTNASGIGFGVGGLDITTAIADNSSGTAGTGFGYSVGGSPTYLVTGGKVDSDAYADFIIGAPFFAGLTTSSANGAPPIGPTGRTNEGLVTIIEGGPLRAAGFFPASLGIGGLGGASPPPGPPPGPPPPPPPGTGSGLAGSATGGFIGFDVAPGLVPPLGEALVPTVSALSKNKYYKPIPIRAALKTYRPDPAFSTRNGLPGNTQHIESRYLHNASGINTLPRSVFDSSKYPKGTDTKGVKIKKGDV